MYNIRIKSNKKLLKVVKYVQKGISPNKWCPKGTSHLLDL